MIRSGEMGADTTAAGSALFGDRTKKILRFLFDLKGRACAPGGNAAG